MKNMEVTHTLRLYDPEFVAKLGCLMEREQKHYRNKNEFMTAVVKMGYERYIAAEQNAQARDAGKPRFAEKPETESETGVPNPDCTAVGADNADGDTLKLLRIVDEMSAYLTAQFRHLHVSQALLRRLISAIYNMSLSLVGGRAVPPEKVEDGFFDDLPARFEKVVVKLEQQYGLKT
jgi:AcrR family transcriptional regulator